MIPKCYQEGGHWVGIMPDGTKRRFESSKAYTDLFWELTEGDKENEDPD